MLYSKKMQKTKCICPLKGIRKGGGWCLTSNLCISCMPAPRDTYKGDAYTLLFKKYLFRYEHDRGSYRTTPDTAGIFATYPAAHLSWAGGVGDQILGSALLLICICAITDNKNMKVSNLAVLFCPLDLLRGKFRIKKFKNNVYLGEFLVGEFFYLILFSLLREKTNIYMYVIQTPVKTGKINEIL